MVIFQGRGFNVQGAHTSGYNSVGYGISFIGDFTLKLPTSGAQDAYFMAVNDCLLPVSDAPVLPAFAFTHPSHTLKTCITYTGAED